MKHDMVIRIYKLQEHEMTCMNLIHVNLSQKKKTDTK